MRFKKTLASLVIAGNLFLPIANASENSYESNKDQYVKKQANDLYPIGLMIGAFAVAGFAAYFALKEAKKNSKKDYK